MPDNVTPCGPKAAAAALIALLAASPLSAQGVYGTFQTTYQRVQDNATLVTGNNALRTQSVSQEVWLRSLDLHKQDYFGTGLMMESNLRYSDTRSFDTGDLSMTPMGSLRLIHRWYQVLASYQPTSTRSTLSAFSGQTPDSSTTRRVTERNHESMVTGHFSKPGLPQLDLSWIARQRDGAGSFNDRNVSRSLRTTFDREHWSVYAGLNDQSSASAASKSGRGSQQVWNAGSSVHLSPFKKTTFNAQYDMSEVRGLASGKRLPSTTTQSGSAGGDWRPTKRFITAVNYQLRHVDFGTQGNAPQTDQEGTVTGRYMVSKQSNVLGSMGLRTVRNTLPSGDVLVGLQKYAAAVASLDARVRRNWTMTSGFSHTTNWDPGRSAYHIETLSGTTRGRLMRKLSLDGTMQVSANSDSGVAASRWSDSWTVRLSGNPLRSLQVSYSLRDQRSGPAPFHSSTASRGMVADVAWRIAPSVQATVQYGSNTVLPRSSENRNSTWSTSVKVQPSSHWQWYGTWTRTGQTVYVSSAGRISSREVASMRAQYQPDRRLAMSGGLSYNDPGKASESRRLDLAFTWSFGR